MDGEARRLRRKRQRHAGNKAAATGRDENVRLFDTQFRRLFGDFETRRPLTGDHQRFIERPDQR
ncbi:hypothetical protein D3C73_1527940 [compost metagenome]